MHHWFVLLSEKQRGEQLWKVIDILAQVEVDMQMNEHNVFHFG
jgi:hypothetical protein